MERLTGRRDERTYIIGCPDFALPKIAGLIIQQTVDRLASIEDILGDEYDLDRLCELARADREGRCVVFRFGFGATVCRSWMRPDGSHSFVSEERMNTVVDLVNAESWGNAYKTREAAEAALKGEQG